MLTHSLLHPSGLPRRILPSGQALADRHPSLLVRLPLAPSLHLRVVVLHDGHDLLLVLVRVAVPGHQEEGLSAGMKSKEVALAGK